VRPALPCPGAGLPVHPGNPALAAPGEFRERLLGCLTARGDALLELADAVFVLGSSGEVAGAAVAGA
jgi:hypothetical protein